MAYVALEVAKYNWMCGLISAYVQAVAGRYLNIRKESSSSGLFVLPVQNILGKKRGQLLIFGVGFSPSRPITST